MTYQENDFDADAASARRYADWLRERAKKIPGLRPAAQIAEEDADRAEALQAFEAGQEPWIDPEDAEGSPWPAVAMVAVVLTAAALAWWFA